MILRRFSPIVLLFAFFSLLPGNNLLGLQEVEYKPYVLKPIKTVYPVYPEHLKKEGIAGEVILHAVINRKGEVEFRNTNPFRIVRKLHPELDQLALEAVRQWTYEPVIINGRAANVTIYISVRFDPGEYLDPNDSVVPEPLSEDVSAFLDQCWAYCKKFDEKADYYICRERIGERVWQIVDNGGASSFGTGPRPDYVASYILPELGAPAGNSYVNEYQINARDYRMTELRTPVKPPAEERDSEFGIKPLSSPIPISLPSRLFAPGYRQEFTFSLGEDKKVLGKSCRTVEVKARKRRGAFVKRALVWVEKDRFRVVKAEVEYDPSVIDERILAECKMYALAPSMSIMYEYEVENKGYLYPSRMEMTLEYAHLGLRNYQGKKASVDITYDQYRYFSVGTEYEIKK